jgi:hypothetical protein
VRLRRPFVNIGAVGLAVVAVGLAAVWTSVGRAHEVRATMPGATIRVNSAVTFAAPPPDAMPALTAWQALRQFDRQLGARPAAVPPGLAVRLGLLTLLVGPDCGADCHALIVKHGLAYQRLNELAYGYSRPSTCVGGNDINPLPPHPCVGWEFVDANTGQLIIATEQDWLP